MSTATRTITADELWRLVLNPKRRTATVHRPGSNPLVLREHETFDAGDVVPGFGCKVGDIFA